MNPKEVLLSFYGYTQFRHGQEEIIQSILDGKNVLAVLPTGGGKSICYQIPAILSNNFSIVISPLIALMKDQVDSINKREPIAAFINSSLDFKDSEKVLHKIANNEIKILYLSPEKLDNLFFVEKLKSLGPEYLFIDEAHCISEWGHNFRPSYRKIKQFIEFIKINKIAAFTATATADVRNDIIEQLGIKEASVFVRGFERGNLFLNCVNTNHKKETTLKLINKFSKPAIIYCATRKMTEEISDYLKANGINAAYYHAGLTSELRRIIQDDFLSGRIEIIAATNAFGMGIDKSDIRLVVHYNLPGNLENYYQEIGRAGRDGKDSQIYLLYDERDRLVQEFFIKNNFATREQTEIVYNGICDYGKVALGNLSDKEIPIDSNFFVFLESKEINRSLFEASVRILKESGYLTTVSEFHKKHLVEFLVDPKKLNAMITNLDDNEIKDLILLLVRDYGSSIFTKPSAINIKTLSDKLNAQTNEIIEGLRRLSQSGLINYNSPSATPSINLLKERIRIDDLKLDFSKARELMKNNQYKLEEMINFVKSEQCRFNFILNYFGQNDPSYKCGKCDACLGTTQNFSKSEFIEERIIELLEELGTSIKKKELISILSGKESSNSRFTSFGSCEHFTKDEIESTIQLLSSVKKIEIKNGFVSFVNRTAILDTNISATQSGNSDYEDELKLFNILRQIRKEAADKFGQSPNMICPDNVLREIANKRPKTPSEILDVNNFTQRMFNKVGEDFLTAINETDSKENLNKKLKSKNIPTNVLDILDLVMKRYSLEDISSLTKLTESIISIQIETLLEVEPNVYVDYLFDKGELSIINKEIDKGITDLKELRKATNDKINYSKLRIALARKRVT